MTFIKSQDLHLPSLPTIALLLASILALCAACDAPQALSPNSDNGLFFADNVNGLAMGWKSGITLVGPQNDEYACDQESGACALGHVALKIISARSLDETALKVIAIEPMRIGTVNGAKIVVEALAQGTVKLEAEVEIEGEVLIDTFDVHVEPVARVGLGRLLEGIAPYSRYAGCTNDKPGAYVFSDPTQLELALNLVKLNAKGEALRGYGKYPITMDPQDSVEFKSYDELRNRLTLTPRINGRVVLRPESDGQALVFSFVGEQAIDNLTPAVFVRDQQGQRSKTTTVLAQGEVYDVALFPTVGGAWLCGGDVTTKKVALTPSTCGFFGEVHDHSEQLIQALNPGECRIRFVVERALGGRGMHFDLLMDVIPGEYAQPGW
ncbi:MAG: hypothetical protein H0U74_02290 [Bradymonadaceae bacterium]|nr:hypothetical protein [Lujinxingiaceae bacterium]